MILQTIQLILDVNGNIIDTVYDPIKSNSNYSYLIQVVSPALITDVVDVTVGSYNQQVVSASTRLRPAQDANLNYLKGSDVINDGKAYASAAADWNVWEAELYNKTISVLQRINASKVGVTVTFSEKVIDANAITKLGTFGSATNTVLDLPTPTTENVGDYYTCNVLTYTSIEAGETFSYNESAYFDGTQWLPTREFNLRQTAPIVYLSVDPSLELVYEGIDLDQTEQIVADLANIDATMVYTQGLLSDKADLVNGIVPANQLPSTLLIDDTDELPEGVTNKYYTEARVSANSSVTSNTAHRDLLTGNPHMVTKAEVGLGSVDNTADADKPISTATQSALDLKADLVGGFIPQSQLPGYVDDVLEYAYVGEFPEVGEAGKIYIALDTNETYRWATTVYVKISDVLDATEIKSMYEANSDTNNFSDILKAKLDAIEDSATADQTGSEIKTLLYAEVDTNNLTDVLKTKLDGIADGAQVNDPSTTLQGNTFNGNAQLVQTTVDGKLPILDGSNLTGLSSAPVASINGEIGVVVLDTDDIAEGVTNKYFTSPKFDTELATKTTDDITEGTTNKFYSDALVSANTTVVANASGVSTNNDAISTINTTLPNKADLVGGLVPANQLPSYVDDVIESATYAALPVTGETGKLYVVIADETSGGNSSTYRWTGSIYVKIIDVLSGAEVKSLYESNADTNAYTTTEKNKLAGVEAGAEVNPTNTDGLIEGPTNKYYTEARVSSNTDVAANKTARTTYLTNFNGSSQLLQLDGAGRLPSLDGSNLTNVSSVADLTDLTDVNIAGQLSGQVVRYNGTNWANADMNMTDLNNVNAVGAASGELLRFDGANWSRWTPTYISSYTETDPLFTAWNKSTGISITESQISDLGAYITAADSLDATKLTGIIPTASLPPLALTDVFTAVDEIEQLALTAEEGDVCIRTDEGVTYIHNGGVLGTMSDWTLLSTPTGSVASINGFTGVVSLTADNIPTGTTNKYYTTSLFNTDLATKSTDNLAEGSTNKYAATNATNQGNIFNGASQLVKLTAGGALPSLDASLLTNLPGALSSVTETISMPTAGWTLVGDFYEATVSTSNVVSSSALCEISPRILSDAIRKAWIEQGVVGVERVTDNSIKVLSNYPNSTVYDLVLVIGSDVPSEQAASAIDDLTNVLIAGAVDNQFLRYNGAAWVNETVITTAPIDSVNSQTGTVVLDTDDILEGVTNKYYDSALFTSDFASKSTSNLSEGTNLYYTQARVSANANVSANSSHRISTGNPHGVTASQVGLAAYSAYSPSTLPISNPTQTALDLKADLTYVDNAVNGLVNAAPGTLNTLNELAAALDDDPNFAATMTTSLANKVDKIANYGLSKNDFSDALLIKLNGISAGAEVNITNSDELTEGTVNKFYTDGKVSAHPAVILNTAKVGITPAQAADIVTNTAKVGITIDQANDIIANTAKIGYTDTLVSSNADVVANTAKISFDIASSAKLAGIETNATADQTGAEIKALYEAELDTNAYTDAEKTKLSGIADGAEVNDANTTLQGNTFNGNSQLVQTTADGKLPVLDGSNLTNIPHPADIVSSVNTQTGIVVLDTDDISEGTTNKYYSSTYVETDRLTDEISISTSGVVTQTINPNTFYKFTSTGITILNINLGSVTAGKMNEYMFEFVSTSTNTILSDITGVSWIGSTPVFTIEANKTYQVSILNGLGIIVGV